MLEGLSPARRRPLVVGAAVVLVVVVAVLVVVALRARGTTAPVAQDRPGPVLLVSGYGGSTRVLQPLRLALRSAGREVVVVPPVDGGTGNIRSQARALDQAVDDALDTYHAKSVDVVGYSAGGVVARTWVRYDDGASRARRVMTIASPHHGTTRVRQVAATLGGCHEACDQLEPGSSFLRALNAHDETPPGPRFISVWSTADQVVVPSSSPHLAGAALDLSVQSICPARRTTHGGMPADPVVLALLRTALGAGRPTAPPRTIDCGIR